MTEKICSCCMRVVDPKSFFRFTTTGQGVVYICQSCLHARYVQDNFEHITRYIEDNFEHVDVQQLLEWLTARQEVIRARN